MSVPIAFTIICFTGFLGCVVDSFIGATCQALYEDKVTGELTEDEKSSNGEDNKGNSNGHFADNTVEMNGIDPMLIWVAGGSVIFIATITTGLLVLLKSFRKKEEQKRSGNK